MDSKKIKILKGDVVSTKMKDTIIVAVNRYVKHSLYNKFYTITKRYKVHDEGNSFKDGDKVSIESCKPISKQKYFRVIKEQ